MVFVKKSSKVGVLVVFLVWSKQFHFFNFYVDFEKGKMRNNHKSNDDYMERMFRAYESMGIDVKRPENVSSTTRRISQKLQGANFSISEANASTQWRVSPRDPRGVLYKASDRPIMCLSVYDENEAVVGSSDHALYTFDPSTGRKKRRLYTKRHGHREWVTCCTYTSTGEILSGGMDSKICVWDRKALRCDEMLGHRGSVSTLLSGKNCDIAISGSYDRTIRVWNVKSRKEMAKISKHKGPILCMDWSRDSSMICGSRDGKISIFDLNDTRKPLGFFDCERAGHVTSVATFQAQGSGKSVYLTGHQDGCVRLWDLRTKKKSAVVKRACHISADGRAGAVGKIVCSNAHSELEHLGGNVIVTAGADSSICVLDPRSSLKPCIRFSHHKDFIYSLACVGSIAVSGSGDGNVLIHDLRNGKLLYGIGANQHAVRCVVARKEFMVTAGDDGSALCFNYSSS